MTTQTDMLHDYYETIKVLCYDGTCVRPKGHSGGCSNPPQSKDFDLAYAVAHLRATPIEDGKFYAWFVHKGWFVAPHYRLAVYGAALRAFASAQYEELRFAAYDKLRPTPMPGGWTPGHTNVDLNTGKVIPR